MWRLGMTSTCTGACGLMSAKASVSSSSCTRVAGMAPETILQKRQSIDADIRKQTLDSREAGELLRWEILGPHARLPRVIGVRERGAAAQGGVVVEQKLHPV